MLACESNSQRVSSFFTCALETQLIMALVWVLGMEQGNFDGIMSDSVLPEVTFSSHGKNIGTFHFDGLVINYNFIVVDRFGNDLLTDDTCAAANDILGLQQVAQW